MTSPLSSAPRVVSKAGGPLIAALVCLGACGVETEIISRVDRDDGQGYATVAEVRGNATVSTVYIVEITETSGDGGPTEILRMDKSEPPVISWRSDGVLLIDAPCGQIYAFKNFAFFRDDQGVERITVILNNSGPCAQS